jgi:hypothetical protein
VVIGGHRNALVCAVDLAKIGAAATQPVPDPPPDCSSAPSRSRRARRGTKPAAGRSASGGSAPTRAHFMLSAPRPTHAVF